MGLTRPADALCARALQRIVAGFACTVLSCPPSVYRALADEVTAGDLRGVVAAFAGGAEVAPALGARARGRCDFRGVAAPLTRSFGPILTASDQHSRVFLR